MDTNKITLLRIDAVMQRVAYKKSSIYHKVQNDLFPKPYIRRSGFTAWLESDIDLFLIYFATVYPDMTWSEYVATKTKEQECTQNM